ncbi:efflux RND transporter periplasmic adaptor subunit [Thermodesulforhabdus norvegica]|uniref:RND family efflux transporter, MFP subunit n=1 Tax=Thermodesulforhabdus norvegica TaxID=39841 RepID=A0A1I4QNN6_9BACT|nr:efflux RND transporter periplasmic adaptor subunit [Thermodesulforhabdus norvegica]SFM41661.1 RND family efflux transporter, MFP subunit [Thermodesulforhabdus norvegica]
MNKKALLQVGLAAFVVFVSLVVMKWLEGFKKPVPTVSEQRPPTAVRVTKVEPYRGPIVIWNSGVVESFRSADLVSQVSGKIIRVSERFVSGGRFKEGEEVIKIEEVDYQLGVIQARAALAEARANLELEEAQAEIARKEWLRSRNRLPVPRLVARIPQVQAAKAKLESAKAQLERSMLDLQRTSIKTPFPCVISEKYVDVGQYVTVGQRLARVFYTGSVEITVPIGRDDLKWLKVPGLTCPVDERGSDAEVVALVGGVERRWQGRVVRWRGQVDEATRLYPVIVRVDRAYDTIPPLAVGTFVNVGIHGSVVKAGILPVSAIRLDDKGGEIVWVVEGGVMKSRPVKVAHRWKGRAYVVSGLKGGEDVVISDLPLATENMPVSIAGRE